MVGRKLLFPLLHRDWTTGASGSLEGGPAGQGGRRMVKESLSVKLTPLGALVVLVVALTSCGVEAMAGVPRVWIDVPRDGAEVSADATVNVVSHAYAREGVAEILLTVNLEPYTRDAPVEPGAAFAQVTQEWFPPGPGQYTLQARAYDTQGQMSNAATVRITVIGEPPELILTPAEVPTATPTSTGMPTETPTATGVPIDTPTSTGVPTDTPTFTGTPTHTPTCTSTSIPKAQVSFWVERDSITAGQCTILHWDVDHATAVYLDGEGEGGHGTRQVCPPSTTTYDLHVAAPSGDVDRQVTVSVIAPADASPPSITKIAASYDTIYSYSSCGPTSVAIMAWVSDPSGVSKAELSYRVVRSPGPVYGSWRTLGMSPAGGDKYQATVGWDELTSSLDPPVTTTSTVEYYVRAWDASNNMSQGGTLAVTLKACLI
jgi:hypothetical protein